MMKKIYVDIDGTICNTVEGKYEDSTPIQEHIDKINNMYDAGCYIVYYTARGQRSGKDYWMLTNDQLEKWGCKFHRLNMGKPDYDLMICDKTKRIEEI